MQGPQINACGKGLVGCPGRRQGTIRADQLKRAEATVQSLDAGEQRLGQSNRRQLAAAKTAPQPGNGLSVKFGIGHCVILRPSTNILIDSVHLARTRTWSRSR